MLIRIPIDRIMQAAEDSVELLCDGPDPIQFATTFTTGIALGSRDREREAAPLLMRATIIQECQLAVCEYCRASADSGETTLHSCVAGPLIAMRDDVMRELEGVESQLSSWAIIPPSETGTG